LGTGFQPDLTGRENVFINGVIHGLTRREVRARFDSIVSFAELEKFIDNPLRIYSDGMRMRLAFSVAAHLEPQILLIDEALAVGDASFQRKCLERIGQFKAQGCTIVLVSHDTHRIQQLCDDVLWLRGGRLQTHGPADASLHQYLAESRGDVAAHGRTTVTDQALRHPQPATLRMGENRFGNLEVEITRVRLLDARRQPITDLQNGEALQIEIGYRARHPALAPIFQIYISREDGLPCYDINSQAEAISTDGAARHRRIVLTIHRLDANRGLYYVDVGAYAPNWAYPYDYHSRVYPLLVHSNDSSTAVMSTGFRWDISRAAARPE
jgi:lipopolysaccharide transport system ATP-binding protein